MRNLTPLILCTVALLHLSCQREAQNNGRAKPASSTLPHFVIQTLNGGNLNGSAFAGKVLVVDFWATWCRPCLKEIPAYNELNRKYREQDFSLLGIAMSSGEAATLESFIRAHDIQYPVYIGSPETAAAFGNITVLPTTFLIDRSGAIVKEYRGTYAGKSEELDNLVQKLLAGQTL